MKELKIGDMVVIHHLKDNKGNYIPESGLVIDIITDPLERIKVSFNGDRYEKPLWISSRFLKE